MKRNAVLLVVACGFSTLAYLAIHSALRPRYFAQGTILLKLKFIEPTDEPSIQDCYAKVVQWYDSQLSAISNMVNNSQWRTIWGHDSAVQHEDIQFAGAYPVRGTSIIQVRFAGNEEKAVWRVASNACVMLTGFYATNRPFELQTTNRVICEVEHFDTDFWAPTPFWRWILDDIEDLFRR